MTHSPGKDIFIIDLEATCWNGHAPSGQVSDIIEIGVARLNIESMEIEGGPEILVTPRRSTVSTFCTELTSITSAMLSDRGVDLQEAFHTLSEYAGNKAWCSWGFYDFSFMNEVSQRYDIDFPLGRQYFNLKQMYSVVTGKPNKGFGMSRALKQCSIDLVGTHHRGLDDACNSAKVLRWMLERFDVN